MSIIGVSLAPLRAEFTCSAALLVTSPNLGRFLSKK